jgi:hypothetical protein
MARKGQRAPTRREVTLETIEEHLKEQGRETKRGPWITFAAVGFSVMLAGITPLIGKVGVPIWIGKCVTNVWAYTFDVWVCFFIVLCGALMIAYGGMKVSKVK